MCQSQQPDVLKAGFAAWALVTNSCQQLGILSEDDHIGAYEQGQNLDRTWIAWRFRETRRRTGFFIWVSRLDMHLLEVGWLICVLAAH